MIADQNLIDQICEITQTFKERGALPPYHIYSSYCLNDIQTPEGIVHAHCDEVLPPDSYWLLPYELT